MQNLRSQKENLFSPELMLVDTHCHINSLSSGLQQETIAAAQGKCVFIDVSIDAATSRSSLELSGGCPFIYTSLGFHPFSAAGFSSELLEFYRTSLSDNKKVVAIGEVGLDYKAPFSFKEQEKIFIEFICLAKEFDLVLVVHNRFKDDSLLGILDRYYRDYSRVVFHCFSYGVDLLKKISARKGYVSFALNILRRKPSLLEALSAAPLDRLLLETDSPYMRIAQRQSTPLDIREVYAAAAAVKKVSERTLSDIIEANAAGAFGIPLKGEI